MDVDPASGPSLSADGLIVGAIPMRSPWAGSEAALAAT
jgi:hypothetical protein